MKGGRRNGVLRLALGLCVALVGCGGREEPGNASDSGTHGDVDAGTGADSGNSSDSGTQTGGDAGVSGNPDAGTGAHAGFSGPPVAAGSTFDLALKADGTVWAWGDNAYGQLGDGTRVPRCA